MPDSLTHAGLGTLAAAVRRRLKHAIKGYLAPYDLTLQQFWVILVLAEQGSLSLHPLAERVWMDDPTASRVVKAMVSRGLLLTRPDPKHGRRITIQLAPESQALATELQALAARIKATLVIGLDADQQAALRHGLTTMICNLEALLARQEAEGPEHRLTANL
jgi:DNA-binding MarR family transcriptional regulator